LKYTPEQAESNGIRNGNLQANKPSLQICLGESDNITNLYIKKIHIMKKSIILTIHFVYWIVFIVLVQYLLTIHSITSNQNGSLLGSLVVYVLIALVSYYTFYFYLVPRFLAHRKGRMFLIRSFGVCIAIAFAIVVIRIISFSVLSESSMSSGESPFLIIITWGIVFFLYTTYALAHGFFATIVRGFIEWVSDHDLIGSKS
jgi:two-component system, LytTR family, sensor kinase